MCVPNIKFVCLILWLGEVCTDANDVDTNNADADTDDAQQMKYDCVRVWLINQLSQTYLCFLIFSILTPSYLKTYTELKTLQECVHIEINENCWGKLLGTNRIKISLLKFLQVLAKLHTQHTKGILCSCIFNNVLNALREG